MFAHEDGLDEWEPVHVGHDRVQGQKGASSQDRGQVEYVNHTLNQQEGRS